MSLFSNTPGTAVNRGDLIVKIIVLVVAIILMITYVQAALLKIMSPWGIILDAVVWVSILGFVLGWY